MRRQTEEWHPAGIQVAGEKKIKIESRRRQQKHGVLLRCVYLYLCMVGTILTFRLDLGMKFRVLPVAGVLLLFVLLAILKSIWRPWGRWVYRGAYLLIFLTGGLGWKHLAAGWQAAENSIRHQLSVYYGVTLAEKTPLLSGERGELLLIVIFALFFWSMETAVVRKGRAGLLVASEILIVLLELMCGCRFLQPGIFLIGGSLLALLAMGQNHGVSNQRILYRSGLWAGGWFFACHFWQDQPVRCWQNRQMAGMNGCIRRYRKKPVRFPGQWKARTGYLAIIIRRRMAV